MATITYSKSLCGNSQSGRRNVRALSADEYAQLYDYDDNLDTDTPRGYTGFVDVDQQAESLHGRVRVLMRAGQPVDEWEDVK